MENDNAIRRRVISIRPGETAHLGRRGENLARRIVFDISAWVETYGTGTARLLVTQYGEKSPYPAAVTQNGSTVIWDVTAADTAKPGSGFYELWYSVGDTLAKSAVGWAQVMESLTDDTTDPPEPQQGWVDQVLAAADETIQAATHPPILSEDNTWLLWDTAAGEYVDTGVNASADPVEVQKIVEDYLDAHPAPVQSVNGKTGAVKLDAESVGARPSTWTPSAADVGADAAGTAQTKIAAHNTDTAAHGDIRQLITGLANRINAIADSEDVDLDQLSELVAYIKSNRALIDSVTTAKVSVTDIVNDLVTNVANKPLSAAQGVALKALIDANVYTLPVATADTLGGVKPVTATEDMTKPVGVDEEGGLFTEPGEKWELINEVTTEEATSSIRISIDSAGKPFALKKLFADISIKYTLADGEAITTGYTAFTGLTLIGYSNNPGYEDPFTYSTTLYYMEAYNEFYPVDLYLECYGPNGNVHGFRRAVRGFSSKQMLSAFSANTICKPNGITTLCLALPDTYIDKYVIAAGTTIKLYGVRM